MKCLGLRMSWLVAVKAPPNEWALIVRVPARVWRVPPFTKLILLPEVPTEMSPLLTWRPVPRFKLPVNELEDAPVEVNWAWVSMPLVAWMPLVVVNEPEKELEPVVVVWNLTIRWRIL